MVTATPVVVDPDTTCKIFPLVEVAQYCPPVPSEVMTWPSEPVEVGRESATFEVIPDGAVKSTENEPLLLNSETFEAVDDSGSTSMLYSCVFVGMCLCNPHTWSMYCYISRVKRHSYYS